MHKRYLTHHCTNIYRHYETVKNPLIKHCSLVSLSLYSSCLHFSLFLNVLLSILFCRMVIGIGLMEQSSATQTGALDSQAIRIMSNACG